MTVQAWTFLLVGLALATLDAPIRAQLARIPENQRTLVTSEGAFSYLTRDYKMKEAYLWPINADEQGTPQMSSCTVLPNGSQEVHQRIFTEGGGFTDRLAGTLLPDRDAPIVVYCSGTCQNSEIAARRLAQGVLDFGGAA